MTEPDVIPSVSQAEKKRTFHKLLGDVGAGKERLRQHAAGVTFGVTFGGGHGQAAGL